MVLMPTTAVLTTLSVWLPGSRRSIDQPHVLPRETILAAIYILVST
jgi:hypothetical protein